MGKRVDPSLREKIKDDPRPVRVIAAELGISKGTVQKWKNRNTFEDRPRTPKRPHGIKPYGIAMIGEFLRLTRYRYQALFEYLAPVWSALPTQERIDCRREGAFWKDCVTGRFVNRIYDPSTFFRQLKKTADGKLLACFDQSTPVPGIIAAHRVRVNWRGYEGEMVAGEILLLLERQSGLIYAKSFTPRIAIESFSNALSNFKQMLPYEPSDVTFVSSRIEIPPKSGNWEHCASLFRFKPEKGHDVSSAGRVPMSANSLAELKDHIPLNADVFIDPGTPNQDKPFTIPGLYAHRIELDKTLAMFCNLINHTPRHYQFRGREVQVCPFERILKELKRRGKSMTQKQLERKTKLPRKFRRKPGSTQEETDQ